MIQGPDYNPGRKGDNIMTREDYIDEFIRHGSDLIPYNTPNYDEVLLERANKYADEMLNPDSKLEKLCEWHDSLIDNHSSDIEEQEDKEPIDNILYAAACGIKNTKIITEEEKQLLLRDLCARLPYSVRVKELEPIKELELYLTSIYHDTVQVETVTGGKMACSIEAIKPYLRPMSSMTEEERRYLSEEFGFDEDLENWELNDFGSYVYRNVNVLPLFDWLNAHHFDYRGLIEKGLALEAPEGMHKTE